MNTADKIPFHISAARQGDRALVRITGHIGFDTDPEQFRSRVDALVSGGAKDVHVYINSPGGSVFDANEIVNILSSFTGRRTGEGGALVASAATFIAVSLDSFTVPENGRFMIHKPSGMAHGTVENLKSYTGLLEGLTADYCRAYSEKAADPEKFRKKWDSGADWWMTSREALEAGFVTAVQGKVPVDRETALMITACGCPVPGEWKIENNFNNDQMDIKTFIVALGLPESTSDADVLRHVIKLSDQNRTLVESSAALTVERDRYRTDYETLKAAADGSEKTALLDAAVADKRITAKEKDAFAKLDTADVQALLADRRAPVNPMTFIAGGGGGAPAGSEQWTFAEWTKNSPDGLAAMRTGDPERYQTLFQAQYGRAGKANN